MRSLRTALLFGGITICATVPAMAQCSWSAYPPGISFGAYNVFSSNTVTSSTSGAIRCIGGYNYTVSLSKGGSGTYRPRRMSKAPDTASYNVYIDTNQQTIYGDGSDATFIFTGRNNSGTNTYSGTVYGAVPGSQDLAQGSYSDNLVAILGYQKTSGGAWAYLPGAAVPVTMTVGAQCRADTFNLAFGNYSPFTAGALTTTSSVKVYCTKAVVATLSLDNGANASGAQKRMRSGTFYLNYSATLASTTPPASTSVLVPLGGGGVTLNGSVPASQDLPIGSYIDTLQVTVNY